MKINSLQNREDRYLIFELISDIIETRKIEYYTPKRTDELSMKIRALDTRIRGTDASILACAIEDAANLVTIDKNLLGNRNIQNEFDMKIIHPKDLI